MPNLNKGRLILAEVISRQSGNDWPTAQVLYTTDVIESASNLYFTNARTVNVITPLLTTSNVVEATNQYFTNTRVLLSLIGANVSLNNLTVSGDLEVQGNIVTINTGVLTVEDKNITLANGAVNAAAADGAGFTIQGANANLTYLASGDRFVFNKNLEATGNLTANGLIIRNINVSDTVLSGNVTAAGISGNTIVVDIITANVWNRLYTANVIETAGNLYFTQSRARASFTAGDNIQITPEGVISATTQAVVSNDSETITVTANTLVYVLQRNITDPKSILVINEGLVQIPTVDYTTAASTITFTSQLPVGSNVEIRYFGIDSAASYSSTFLATVNTFVGNGSNLTYPLTTTPGGDAYVAVIVDGVYQQVGSYSVIGSSILFSEAPANGANIDVRIYAGAVGASFNTRTYTGDGSNVSFPVTSGFTAQNILVFENGVAQVPGTDYTVDLSGNLVFTTAPASNILIQVRELGTGAANLVNQIAGRDIRTGNLEPLIDGAQTIGSANLKYGKVFLAASNSLVVGNTTVSISSGTITLTDSGSTSFIKQSTAGDFITIEANGRINATLSAGNNITVEANGRISSTASGGGTSTAKVMGYNLVFGG